MFSSTKLLLLQSVGRFMTSPMSNLSNTAIVKKSLRNCQRKKKEVYLSLKHCEVKASLASGSPSFAQFLCNLTDAFHFYAEHRNPSMCIFIQKAKQK